MLNSCDIFTKYMVLAIAHILTDFDINHYIFEFVEIFSLRLENKWKLIEIFYSISQYRTDH